ncbi:acyl-CoA dehydrogenase [Mucilaginibacter sp. HMF5004]|uniref:acyl-CoA dehydrogenase n=1 Tax=Mucilaginibacter rivuli TaxID=2857527 RepID=UPI001C5F095D|nr:acyl-CoA dehydrogenase [Mucilaginibacter rivuli]MBW4890228.1 acyl-CoA dehydrogenase [Mucilaginibacter rivuli]
MNILSHPSQQLTAEQTAIIRNDAAAAESDGKLQPAQLELVYEQQWFKMLTPETYTGMELSLPDEVRLIEALSWADGSMGWAVTLCTGAGWFGGFLDAELSKRIFADREVCLAGSGAPTGTAILADGGYIISGTWKYASGALHATHLTANCIIHTPDARVEVRPFIFDRKDVTVLPAWNYTGMVATGSHSFEVNNLHVSADRCFKIDPDFAVIQNPLYQYPFHQLAEATLAVNLSGMAIHFMDLCVDLFAEKKVNKGLSANQSAELDEALAKSVYRLNAIRPTFYDTLDDSWADYLGDSGTNPTENLNKVSMISRKLAKTSLQIVDELYPYCGLIAASTGSEINRVWRDMHTASQHALLTFAE